MDLVKTCRPSVVAIEPDVSRLGFSLSEFLGDIERRFAKARIEGWIRCEILNITTASSGHRYMELVEHDSRGKKLASCKGILWASRWEAFSREFRAATGHDLAGGTKVLIYAKALFGANWGFSLELNKIDPTYTLGDLEIRKQAIRNRLSDEGIWALNRSLEAPCDYFDVAVIASSASAGIGDFRIIADRLQILGLCSFRYFDAIVQGESAAGSICRALDTIQTRGRWGTFSAIVILRGGGAASDLMAFNDERLIRKVALSSTPIISAIGHHRDSNLIDEVAWKSCSTPKEASVQIRDCIVSRCLEVDRVLQFIVSHGERATSTSRAQLSDHMCVVRGLPTRVRLIEKQLYGTAIRLRNSVFLGLEGVHSTIKSAEATLLHQPRNTIGSGRSLLREHLKSLATHSWARIPVAELAIDHSLKILRTTPSQLLDAEKSLCGYGHQLRFGVHLTLNRVRAGMATVESTLRNVPETRVGAVQMRSEQLMQRIILGASSRVNEAKYFTQNLAQTVSPSTLNSIGLERQTLTSMRGRVLSNALRAVDVGQSEIHQHLRKVKQNSILHLGRIRLKTEQLQATIRILGPESVLRRGYAIIRDQHSHKFVTTASQASKLNHLSITFHDGSITATRSKDVTSQN